MTTVFVPSAQEWRPVRGYEGLYEISSEGELRSLHGRKPSGRLGIFLNDRGYRRAWLSKGGKVSCRSVHHLVLEAFNPEPRRGRLSRHLNGQRADNRATNLAWGTQKENMADRLSHGKTLLGERNVNSKLTAEDVRRIRESFLFGARPIDLGGLYGVSPGSISNLTARRSWRHLD